MTLPAAFTEHSAAVLLIEPSHSPSLAGVLLLSTQLATYLAFSAEGLDPYLGASYEVDVRLICIANEVVVDVFSSAVALTAFRIFRWWDAKQYFGD